ncbi:class I SAM-dependent methyltransferase [Acidicapsa acidisoli]|uniref:class I SAM-dependent methyltransferase n=1 Tax=Acidicapsa acidisoli TaxID=1615681 RepID=UPI0021E0B750|nr:class I SAM-dependent methyltransferase [Acidicapsa acidisoli]
MLGIPVRYFLKHPVVTVADIAADPLQLWMTIQDEYAAAREGDRPKYQYESNDDWEQRLHESLGVPWPCEEASEFWTLWSGIIRELQAKGIRPGPESFQWWNDGDAGLVRAIWCLIRHTKPEKVVETGVAHGVTSRCILEALARNGDGHLWSIDLPPVDRFWRNQVGAAIGEHGIDRWTYLSGSSRRRLPELLSYLGKIDLFIHDSLHSERNVRFELDRAWEAMGTNGAFVVDDVDANWGFRSFTQAFAPELSLICEAEPLHPDLRRFNQKGLFGIILKQPVAHGLIASGPV